MPLPLCFKLQKRRIKRALRSGKLGHPSKILHLAIMPISSKFLISDSSVSLFGISPHVQLVYALGHSALSPVRIVPKSEKLYFFVTICYMSLGCYFVLGLDWTRIDRHRRHEAVARDKIGLPNCKAALITNNHKFYLPLFLTSPRGGWI